MKQILRILLMLILVSSCQKNKLEKPQKPDNLISKDKMVEILYDMSVMSAAKGINRKLLESTGIYPEDYIFEKHKIDSIQFAESNAYYAFDLKTYQTIYSKVKEKLEVDKLKYQGILNDEKVRRDSIVNSRRSRDTLKPIQNRSFGDSLKILTPSPLKNKDSSL